MLGTTNHKRKIDDTASFWARFNVSPYCKNCHHNTNHMTFCAMCGSSASDGDQYWTYIYVKTKEKYYRLPGSLLDKNYGYPEKTW